MLELVAFTKSRAQFDQNHIKDNQFSCDDMQFD